MRTGTYRDHTGQLATVHTTPAGHYLIRYANGHVVSIPTTATTSAPPAPPVHPGSSRHDHSSFAATDGMTRPHRAATTEPS
jgi:hypothetical protein